MTPVDATPRTVDAAPPVLIVLGLIMVAFGIHDLIRPGETYAQEHLSFSKRPDTTRGRVWNWWVRTGFSVTFLLLGLLSLSVGAFRLFG